MHTAALMQRLPRPLAMPTLELPVLPMRLSTLGWQLIPFAVVCVFLVYTATRVRRAALVAVSVQEKPPVEEKPASEKSPAKPTPSLVARIRLSAGALPAVSVPRIRLPTFNFDLGGKLLALLGEDEEPAPDSPGIWTLDGNRYRLPGQPGGLPMIKIGPPPQGRRHPPQGAQQNSNSKLLAPPRWHPVQSPTSPQPQLQLQPQPPQPSYGQVQAQRHARSSSMGGSGAGAGGAARHRRAASAPSLTLAVPATPAQISPTPPSLASPMYTVDQMGGYAAMGAPMSMAKLIMAKHSARRPRGLRSYSIGVPSALRSPV